MFLVSFENISILLVIFINKYVAYFMLLTTLQIASPLRGGSIDTKNKFLLKQKLFNYKLLLNTNAD